MERDNENSEEKTLVPIVPADNDVFSPGFCSLLDRAFQTGAGNTDLADVARSISPDMDTG